MEFLLHFPLLFIIAVQSDVTASEVKDLNRQEEHCPKAAMESISAVFLGVGRREQVVRLAGADGELRGVGGG